jgi:hypothetical protein
VNETDFIFAWLLAAKSGSGIAVAWKTSTIEANIKEARAAYQAVQTQTGETDATHSRAAD